LTPWSRDYSIKELRASLVPLELMAQIAQKNYPAIGIFVNRDEWL
jgi:hypothetical protein